MDYQAAMIICAAVIVFIPFMGGFKAVCWTDFFQGHADAGGDFCRAACRYG